MNTPRLVVRSLSLYWRTHLGVLTGAAIAGMVISGALVVGDSVRHTLSRQVEHRIGRVDVAMQTNDRFVRDDLADDLAESLQATVAPAILLRAVASTPDGAARANRVSLLGVDERFWRLGPDDATVRAVAADEVLINDALAKHLGVEPTDVVVMRAPKSDALPRDVPLGSASEAVVVLRLRVGAILTDEQFGQFALHADPRSPFNAFVNLTTIQEKLERTGRANLLLAGNANGALAAADASRAVARHWQLEDAQLEVGPVMDGDQIELRSSRIFLDDAVITAIQNLDSEALGVLSYFVNELRAGDRTTPYSIVAAIGYPTEPHRPVEDVRAADVAPDSIVLNTWLAEDLAAGRGDTVRISYFTLAEGRRLVEANHDLVVRDVVEMNGLAADGDLMPNYPGLADAEHCREWEPGVPVELSRIRDKDEEYWDRHRGTPKAFLPLATGQRLWKNPFGRLTALRIRSSSGAQERLEQAVLSNVDPAALGLFFRDLRNTAGRAAAPMVDFGGLFLGMSFFIIVAALLLSGLMFAFGVEQRAVQTGLLLAVGFERFAVVRLVLAEAAVLALPGAALGIVLGIFYARGVLLGLTTLWSGAVGGSPIGFHATWTSVFIGGSAAFLMPLLTAAWTLHRQLRRPAHQLLSMNASNAPPMQEPSRGRHRLALAFAAATSLAAIALLFTAGQGRGPEAAGFFFGSASLLLMAALTLCGTILSRLARCRPRNGHGMRIWHLGVRNAARRRGRSLATTALLSCGCFLIVAVNGNRMDPLADAERRDSGTGGFALVAEATVPIIHDLNDSEGRAALGLDDTDFLEATVVPLRVREGDDASCLNLGSAQLPRLLGVDPQALVSRGAFTKESSRIWALLAAPAPAGEVPAVADHATLKWALGKSVGDRIAYTDEAGRRFDVRIVAMIGDSLFQGSLVIDRRHFERRYPGIAGYRTLLIDAPTNVAAPLGRTLSRALADHGLEVTPTVQKLRRFLAVQNTYLSIFQALGGLGLLLGSGGLGMVVLRNVMERRGELALLRAVGYSMGQLRWMLFSEHTLLLALGLATGVITAIVAIIPALRSPGVRIPYGLIATTLAAVTLLGGLWVWLAAVAAVRGKLVEALQSE